MPKRGEGGWKRCCLEAEKEEAGVAIALAAYNLPLVVVSSFKYLGRILLASFDNWPVLIRNLQRSQKK